MFSKKRVIPTLGVGRTLRDRRPKRTEEERPMMDLSRTIRGYGLFGLMLALILPFTASAAGPEDYRFPRDPGTTKDGYPLPLSGKPITKTPVITRTPGAAVKKYPEHYIPGKETLAKDEMRITACGSWGPAPMRIGQGAFWSDKPRRTCSPGPRRRQSLRKDWT